MFVTRPADAISQFFVRSTYLNASYFKIVSAICDGYDDPTLYVSKTLSLVILLYNNQTFDLENLPFQGLYIWNIIDMFIVTKS